jgi:hypothetical protein
MTQNVFPELENEMTANALRARRNELEEALREPVEPERAKEICNELAEIGTAIDKLYLPVETFADAKMYARFGCAL